MPLWTILTKCPAPFGPQCSQPRSAVVGGVADAQRAPVSARRRRRPGASVSKIGASRSTASVGPADHQAVAALEAVGAAARADVDVVDAVVGGERLGPVDVVAVPRVAAVDDRVAALEQRRQRGDRRVDERRRAP